MVSDGSAGLGTEPSGIRMGALEFKSLLTLMLRSLSRLFCLSHLMAPVPALPATKEVDRGLWNPELDRGPHGRQHVEPSKGTEPRDAVWNENSEGVCKHNSLDISGQPEQTG